MIISHSKLYMYEKCQKAYKYRYIYGLKELPTLKMASGSALHKVYQQFFDNKLGGDIFSLDHLKDIYATEFEKILSAGWHPVNKSEVTNYREKINQQYLKGIKQIINSYYQLNRLEVMLTEQSITCPYHWGHHLKGIIDIIDKNGAIYDLKFSNAISPEKYMASLQHSFYFELWDFFSQMMWGEIFDTDFHYLVISPSSDNNFLDIIIKKETYKPYILENHVKTFLLRADTDIYGYHPPGSYPCLPQKCQYWDLCIKEERKQK